MKGTEKQIAWAQDIKRYALANLESNITLYTDCLKEYDNHPLFAANIEAYKIMRAVIEGIFAAHDDAEYIINHREKLTPSGYTTYIDRWSELIRSGKKTAEQIARENGLKDYQA